MQDWALPAEAIATVLLVVVSAKTHGRQVRLEREQHGIWQVDFRAQNDAWVEALWRRDRVWFWGLFPIFIAGGMAIVALRVRPQGAAWAGWLATAVGWALAGCFITMGLASSARLMTAMKDGVPSEDWRKAGHRGSLLWWGLVAITATLCCVVLLP